MAKAQRRWPHPTRAAPPESMPDIQKMQRTWPLKSSTSHMARAAREVPTYREIIARAGMKKL